MPENEQKRDAERQHLAGPPDLGRVKYVNETPPDGPLPEPLPQPAPTLTLDAPEDDQPEQEMSDEEWYKTPEGQEYIAELAGKFGDMSDRDAVKEGRFGDVRINFLEKREGDFFTLFKSVPQPLKPQNLPDGISPDVSEKGVFDGLSGPQKYELLKGMTNIAAVSLILANFRDAGFRSTNEHGYPVFTTKTPTGSTYSLIDVLKNTNDPMAVTTSLQNFLTSSFSNKPGATVSLLFADNMGDMCTPDEEKNRNSHMPGRAAPGCAVTADVGLSLNLNF